MIHNFTDDQITQLLNKIDQIAQRATQGPWLANDRGIGYEITTQQQIDEAAEVNGWPMPINSELRETFQRSDAEFIALSRTALPTLAQTVRAVLELHEPIDDHIHLRAKICSHRYCVDEALDQMEYPCPTVQAITEALGGTV